MQRLADDPKRPNVRVVDGLLDSSLINDLANWCLGSGQAGWRFGDQVDADSEHRFWGATIYRSEDKDNLMFTQVQPGFIGVWDCIERSLLPTRFEVRDIWLNGLTYGLESGIHRDRPDDKEGWYTAMVYLNSPWQPSFGGETLFYNEDRSTIEAAVVPEPGRVVFFDARIPHWGRAPTKAYPYLRLTLAYHLTRKPKTPLPVF